MNTTRLRAGVVALAATLALPSAAQAADPGYADAVLADGPLAYYRLSEAPGAAIAVDATAAHRDGAYVGTPTLDVAGPFADAGKAVRLKATDGVTAGVPGPSGSVELWVNPDRLARGQQAGIAAHGDPAGDGWALGFGAKRKLAWVSGGAAVTSKVSLSAGVWTLLTVTWTDKKVEIYRNGALAKSIARNGATPVSAGGALALGGTGAGAFTGGFAGRLDEAALYAQVLSAAAVRSHFVAARVPINTALPTITGTAAAGGTLTVLPGSWTDGGTATYQWQRCDAAGEDCEDIAGATATTYGVGGADECATLQVAETMTNALGAGTAISDPPVAVAGNCAGAPGGADPGPAPATTDAPAGGVAPGTATGGDPVPSTTTGGCLKLLAGARTARVRRLGTLRLRATAGSCLTTPLRASFKVRSGVRLRSVRYTLDGRRLKRIRSGARLRPAALGAGTHTLKLRVTPRHGRAQGVRLRLRVAAG